MHAKKLGTKTYIGEWGITEEDETKREGRLDANLGEARGRVTDE
jgi:hypothetical protein